MFEVAASAAATVALPASASTAPALLGISIPAPLPLAAQAAGSFIHAAGSSTLLSVVLDTASGRLTVQSQAATGPPPRLHLTASAGIAPPVIVAAAEPNASGKRLAAALQMGASNQHASGTAVADLQQSGGSQAAQYNVHPAVLDCCTQVCKPSSLRVGQNVCFMYVNMRISYGLSNRPRP